MLPALVRLPVRLTRLFCATLSIAVTPWGTTRLDTAWLKFDPRLKVPPSALPRLPSWIVCRPDERTWYTARRSAGVNGVVGVTFRTDWPTWMLTGPLCSRLPAVTEWLVEDRSRTTGWWVVVGWVIVVGLAPALAMCTCVWVLTLCAMS